MTCELHNFTVIHGPYKKVLIRKKPKFFEGAWFEGLPTQFYLLVCPMCGTTLEVMAKEYCLIPEEIK